MFILTFPRFPDVAGADVHRNDELVHLYFSIGWRSILFHVSCQRYFLQMKMMNVQESAAPHITPVSSHFFRMIINLTSGEAAVYLLDAHCFVFSLDEGIEMMNVEEQWASRTICKE